jgi:hypothetical protein
MEFCAYKKLASFLVLKPVEYTPGMTIVDWHLGNAEPDGSVKRSVIKNWLGGVPEEIELGREIKILCFISYEACNTTERNYHAEELINALGGEGTFPIYGPCVFTGRSAADYPIGLTEQQQTSLILLLGRIAGHNSFDRIQESLSKITLEQMGLIDKPEDDTYFSTFI